MLHLCQAVRYLMRFQTEYTCGLLNVARHTAFGKEAANMVVTTFEGKWPKVCWTCIPSALFFLQDRGKQTIMPYN